MSVKGRRKAKNVRRVRIIRVTEEQVYLLGISLVMSKSAGSTNYWASALNPLTDDQRADIGNNHDFGALGYYAQAPSITLLGD